MVLIIVLFPRPVWPAKQTQHRVSMYNHRRQPTNEDDIKLEAALEELVLDLASDSVETDIRRCANFLGLRSGRCAGHSRRRRGWRARKGRMAV
jgi:hypothetical protein